MATSALGKRRPRGLGRCPGSPPDGGGRPPVPGRVSGPNWCLEPLAGDASQPGASGLPKPWPPSQPGGSRSDDVRSLLGPGTTQRQPPAPAPRPVPRRPPRRAKARGRGRLACSQVPPPAAPLGLRARRGGPFKLGRALRGRRRRDDGRIVCLLKGRDFTKPHESLAASAARATVGEAGERDVAGAGAESP